MAIVFLSVAVHIWVNLFAFLDTDKHEITEEEETSKVKNQHMPRDIIVHSSNSDVIDQEEDEDDDDDDDDDIDDDDDDESPIPHAKIRKPRSFLTGRGVTIAMLIEDGIMEPGEKLLSIDYLVRSFFY